MPFVDVNGSAEIVAPEQNGPTGLNVGVVLLFTTIVKVVEAAHCPAFGVNV